MQKDALKSIVLDQRETNVLKTDLIQREAFVRLKELAETPFIISIAGLRRCGKSTLLKQLLSASPVPVYALNFDDERLLQFTVADFQALDEIFQELFGTNGVYFFDEIQNIPQWERFVRRLHDAGKKVYITGSNAALMSSELGTHLTGRYIPLQLYPFSFREYVAFKKIMIRNEELETTSGRAHIKKTFHAFMKEGGLPEYIQTGEIYYLRTLYENIIYRDIIQRHDVRKEKTLKELVDYLISNTGKEFSYTSLRKILGLSNAETVKEYIGFLNDSYLIQSLKRYDYSLKKQLNAPKKAYAIDTALSHSVSFRFSEDLGRQLENIVFLELNRRYQGLFYHHHDKECDFIVAEKEHIEECYQVTWNMQEESTRLREINGLLDAMDVHNLDEGTILTMDETEEMVRDDKRIHILPVWKWLLE